RSLHADSKTSCSKHNTKTGNERNTASDISPGISVGRDGIHPVRLCHIGKHGVIEYQAGRISGLREYKNSQEPYPRGQESQQDTSEYSDSHRNGKYNLLKILRVCDRSECRT